LLPDHYPEEPFVNISRIGWDLKKNKKAWGSVELFSC